MSDGMFRTVSGMRRGYDPDEVDEFFSHARSVYEQGPRPRCPAPTCARSRSTTLAAAT